MGATEAIAPANDDLQGSLPIADIKYGVVRTRDGGYAALFEVLPTNYFLQSTAERIRIISSLAAWLRIVPDNLQILCLSQPVDVEQYTRRMEGFLQSEGDALCRTCIEDNINEVNQLVRYGAFTTRFYIAYRYEPSMVSGEVSYAKIAAALRQVMDSSVGYLARCGLNVANSVHLDIIFVSKIHRSRTDQIHHAGRFELFGGFLMIFTPAGIFPLLCFGRCILLCGLFRGFFLSFGVRLVLLRHAIVFLQHIPEVQRQTDMLRGALAQHAEHGLDQMIVDIARVYHV